MSLIEEVKSKVEAENELASKYGSIHLFDWTTIAEGRYEVRNSIKPVALILQEVDEKTIAIRGKTFDDANKAYYRVLEFVLRNLP